MRFSCVSYKNRLRVKHFQDKRSTLENRIMTHFCQMKKVSADFFAKSLWELDWIIMFQKDDCVMFCKSFFFGQGHTYVENRSLFGVAGYFSTWPISTILYFFIFFKIEHNFYNKYCFLRLWLKESLILRNMSVGIKWLNEDFFFKLAPFFVK